MSGVKELPVNLPILDQVVEAIGREGVYRGDLTPAQMESLLRSVLEQVAAGQHGITATVPTLNAEIATTNPEIGPEAAVSGKVQVRGNRSADVDVSCRFANDPTTPGKLVLSKPVSLSGSGAVTSLKLGVNTLTGNAFTGGEDPLAQYQDLANTVLQDPRRAVTAALQHQLGPRGIEITGCGLQLTEGGQLHIGLGGRRIATPPASPVPPTPR